MPTTQEQPGFTYTEFTEGSLFALGNVACAVGLAIAVKRDAVRRVRYQCEVDEFVGFGILCGSAEIPRALTVIAPGHPLLGLALGKDDGIEDAPAERFHGDYAAARLVEGGEGDPGFQGLGVEVLGQRSGARERALSVEDQPTIPDHGAIFQFHRQLTSQVLAVLLEGPPRCGRRTVGSCAGLEAGAEFQRGEGFFRRLFFNL